MKQLPKRGPVVLWTGPNQYRLIAEIFEADGGLVVMRAHWPDADSPPAAQGVDLSQIRHADNNDAPWLMWTLEDDDKPRLLAEWATWLERRDKDGTTREDARLKAENGLDIKIEEVNGDTVELR